MTDAPQSSDSARVAARSWPIPRQRRALAIAALVVVALLALIWLIGRWRAPPYQQSVLALAQAQSNRLIDIAALFQSLAGTAP
jgi:hypothetical protein